MNFDKQVEELYVFNPSRIRTKRNHSKNETAFKLEKQTGDENLRFNSSWSQSSLVWATRERSSSYNLVGFKVWACCSDSGNCEGWEYFENLSFRIGSCPKRHSSTKKTEEVAGILLASGVRMWSTFRVLWWSFGVWVAFLFFRFALVRFWE